MSESSPGVEARGRGLTARGCAVALVGVHALIGLLLFDPTLFTGGDNAGYMILADALRSGEGYRDLYLPDAPLHTKYPPGYPMVLAAVGFAGGLQLFKLVSLACTSAAVWFTYRLARIRLGGPAAVAATGLVAVNPVLLEYSHYELSEALFATVVMGSLVAWANSTDETGAFTGGMEGDAREASAEGRGWIAGLGASVGAFLVRTAGLPLLCAVWLYQLGRRRWRRLAASLGAGGAAVGGWLLYQSLAGGEEEGYLQQLFMVNPYDPAAGTAGPQELLGRAARNLWIYTSDVLPHSLLGEPLRGDGATVATALGLGVAILTLTGWLSSGNRRLGVPELFLPLYAALILLWPDQWTDRRFLLPLLPLILIYTIGGVQTTARRWREESASAAVAAGAALLALPALASAAIQAPERVRCTTAHWRDAPCVAPAWSSFYDAARWAGAHTPEDAVIVNRKPRIFYWLSGRRGDVYPYSREPAVVLSNLEEIGGGYVVVDQLFSTTAAYLVPAIRSAPDRFEVVYGEGEPRTFILRFRPRPPVAAEPDPEDGEGRRASGPAPSETGGPERTGGGRR